jgi:hypothetical protein
MEKEHVFIENTIPVDLSDQAHLKVIAEQMNEIAFRVRSMSLRNNDAEFLFIASSDLQRIAERI